MWIFLLIRHPDNVSPNHPHSPIFILRGPKPSPTLEGWRHLFHTHTTHHRATAPPHRHAARHDPDSAAHCVTVTRQHVKTDHGIDRNQPGRFPLSFPRRFAGLATALRNFTAARAAVYPTATHFFELPGERFTEKTNFGDALGRMLGTALTTVSLQPPEGRVYTARSLRSGGASAAEMVPLPRSKIEFLGGWAVDSKRLSQHYISRATPPTYAGRFFFDWLILPLADNMALDFPS